MASHAFPRLAALSAGLLAAPLAHGSVPAPAEPLCQQANAAFLEASYAEAAELYRACRDGGCPAMAVRSMARAREELADCAGELDALAAFVAAPDAPGAERAAASERLERLRIAPSPLEVASEPRGASVWIDGALIGVTPLVRELAPGRHVVRVEALGHTPREREVWAGCGRRQIHALALTPIGALEIAAGMTTVEVEYAPDEGGQVRHGTSHVGQLGAILAIESEPRHGALGTALSVTFGATPRIEVGASLALHLRAGTRLWATWMPLPRARIKPMVEGGLTAFFVDGLSPGGRAGAGVQFDLDREIGIRVGAAVEYFVATPRGYDPLAVLLTAGLHGRAF